MNKEMEKGLVPKLRFSEFKDLGKWNTKSLRFVCNMQAGKFVSASEIKDIFSDELYPCFGGNGLRGFVKSFTHSGKYSLIGRQGALCGNINLVSGKFHATEHAVVVTPNNGVNTDWLYYKLVFSNLNQYATGQAQPGLSVENLEKVEITIPSEETEQTKIAACLSSLDDLITAQTQKIEALKTHKKGLMQQLFSQQLRFKNDDGKEFDNWEEKSLDSFLVERNTQTPKSNKYPLMAFVANKGVTSKGDKYNREFLVNDEKGKKYKQTEYEDFIYSSNNLETGSIGLNNYGCATISPVYSIFEIKKSCNRQFIGSLLVRKEFINKMLKSRQGVVYGQWKIHESEFLKIKEKLPCFEEQTKIADCLSSLDDLINAHVKKYELLKTHKKGLMQGLFPSSNEAA
jgi:type I restriction enzyme S subunit